MTRQSLLDAERDNVIQVYVSLALQMPSTHKLRQKHCQGCVSLSPYSFCNFAIGLSGWNANEAQRGVHHLVELAKNRPLLRVIWMTGDHPENWRDLLMSSGFRPSHHLVKMAWSPGQLSAGKTSARPAATPHDRALIADFMVRQFFAMNERHFQAAVARATRSVDFPLFAKWVGERPIATMMLAETENAIGLYNLAVLASERRRGHGAELVAFAQEQAYELKKPLVLQCDAGLVPWYRRQGFEAIGEMQSFHYHR